jgi:hypothetical protein
MAAMHKYLWLAYIVTFASGCTITTNNRSGPASPELYEEASYSGALPKRYSRDTPTRGDVSASPQVPAAPAAPATTPARKASTRREVSLVAKPERKPWTAKLKPGRLQANPSTMPEPRAVTKPKAQAPALVRKPQPKAESKPVTPKPQPKGEPSRRASKVLCLGGRTLSTPAPGAPMSVKMRAVGACARRAPSPADGRS